MLSAALVVRIEPSPWFQVSRAPYLLVDADLRIRVVNAAYEQATAHPDAEKAAVLAALGLEARAGHPPLAGPVVDQRSTFN